MGQAPATATSTAGVPATAPGRRAGASVSRVRAAHLVWLLVGALIVVRTALALHDLSRPGLEQDETLFVNAATLRLPGVFIQDSFHGIPLMDFPYIGALKSWIYAPIFSVFGTSPAAIRVPVLLIVAVGLLLVFVAVRDLINLPVALLALAVLCFDNSVMWLTRDDIGPSAIEFTLKCAGLFCAARYARGLRLRWIVLLLVTLALGTFNKLNYIWVVNGAAAVSLVVIARYRHSLRAHWKAAAVWFGGLVPIYAAWAAYYLANNIASIDAGATSSLTQPWWEFTHGTRDVLAGTWFYNYALAPLGARDVVAWIVVVLFAAGSVAAVAWPRTRSLPVAAIALATVAISGQTLFTPQATAGWHYVAIYPFVIIVAAYGVFALAQAVVRGDRSRARSRAYAIMAGVGVVAVAYSAVLVVKYFDVLGREPKDAAWSPAIYTLSADVRHTGAHVFSADWGIFDALFALDPSTRYTELAYTLEDSSPANLAAIASAVAGVRGPKLIVTHVDARLLFPTANVNTFKALGHHLHLVQTIDGAGRVPVYQVYSYR
jgi:4-amino-4-deoxy-L-arabinose transferase-like glycosyltransferase